MKLSELKAGEKGIIVKVSGRGAFRKRIIEMGFIKGKLVEVIHNAPLKDPIIYKVMDYEVSLRRRESSLVEIVSESEIKKIHSEQSEEQLTFENGGWYKEAIERSKVIHVALVGNPNSGKTSLFNIASGSKERVGNYSGVTVDAKEGVFKYREYTFKLVDLPGTYSLTAYSPEELYVRKQISSGNPDIIINVVSSSNLERNLYLTTQLIDMDVPMVIALNMYDELEASGTKLDHPMLSLLIGASVVPTVGKTGRGIDRLFDEVISTYEGHNPVARHIHINYGEVLERAITEVSRELKKNDLTEKVPPRFISIKLLENDQEIKRYICKFPNAGEISNVRDKEAQKVHSFLKEDCETAFTDARYGFIDGALKETYREGKKDILKITRTIDFFVTHKFWGYPIFFLFMFLMFEGSFVLGAYPVEWLEKLVGWISGVVNHIMPEGTLKDLISDGIIGGVGNVLVFLPNIVLLYLFISFMEDSGYMARAAFIMDKFMHKIGLHGKSFIPLVMGFGCNVPAIMSARTIESRNSRLITILINPLMSCSARLPVYLLLTGAFFSKHQGAILLGLYAAGIILAALMSHIFKRFLIKEEDIPFVMELPPYRMPTTKAIVHHMWDKASQYMKKMGGIILAASIFMWFLSYYPRHDAHDETLTRQEAKIEHQKNSYIGQLGRFVEPVLRPLGFDWKISVGLLSGMAAKEVVVSTLGVLYTGADDDEVSLKKHLVSEKKEDGTPAFSQLTVICLLLFVLIYFPCVATIAAIKNESGSWKWTLFAVTYTTALAWVVCFIVYQLGSLLCGKIL
jgi:ferrous iron transport protein B